MLKNIEWRDFLLGIFCLLIIYYWFLLSIYRIRAKKKGNVHPSDAPFDHPSKKRIWQVEEIPAGEDAPDLSQPVIDPLPTVKERQNQKEDEFIPTEEEKAFDSLELLAGEIEQIISERGRGIEKTELLSLLQKEIARYPVLNRKAFRYAISNLIFRETQQHPGIAVTAEEAEQLWVAV